jgi:hypothetical protein
MHGDVAIRRCFVQILKIVLINGRFQVPHVVCWILIPEEKISFCKSGWYFWEMVTVIKWSVYIQSIQKICSFSHCAVTNILAALCYFDTIFVFMCYMYHVFPIYIVTISSPDIYFITLPKSRFLSPQFEKVIKALSAVPVFGDYMYNFNFIYMYMY